MLKSRDALYCGPRFLENSGWLNIRILFSRHYLQSRVERSPSGRPLSPEIYEISPLLDFYRIDSSSGDESSSSDEEIPEKNNLTADHLDFQRVSINQHLTVEGTMDLPIRTSWGENCHALRMNFKL